MAPSAFCAALLPGGLLIAVSWVVAIGMAWIAGVAAASVILLAGVVATRIASRSTLLRRLVRLRPSRWTRGILAGVLLGIFLLFEDQDVER